MSSPFKVQADSEHITINGFRFAPAEAESLSNLVSFAGGMRNFEALPPHIQSGNFKVSFYENGSLKLTREEAQECIEFDFGTVDILISTILSGLNISTDAKTLRPSPRATGAYDFSNTGVVIEGR